MRVSACSVSVAEALETRRLLAVSLVKDINLDGEGGTPQETVEAGGRLFFSAWDRAHGNELWVSDGSQEGTRLLADLVPGPGSSGPSRLTPAGGKVYFATATEGDSTGGLWVTDGTAQGTRRLTVLQPLGAMFEAGGLLFFQANSPGLPGLPAVGGELYVSDGTEAGTRLVKDITPGAGGTFLPTAFERNNRLLFAVGSGPQAGLWITDGTDAGTFRVHDVIPGRHSGESSPSWALGPGGFAYFAGSTPEHGIELWRTDGTPAGTSRLTDLQPGSASSTPVGLSFLNGRLYFHTLEPGWASGKLWSTDGTAAGTTLVKVIDAPGSIPSAIVQPRPGGPALFVAGSTLWRTDGTEAGTSIVHQHPQWGFAHSAVASGGWFYYNIYTYRSGFGEQELWRSDGTAANTQRVNASLPSPPPYPLGPAPVLDFRGDVFFTGSPAGTYDHELMRLPPDRLTPDVIQTNAAQPYSSSPERFFAARDRVYFLTRPNGYGSYKLWCTDGTEAGTVQVFDTGYDPYMGGIPNWGADAFGNSIVFSIGPRVWLAGPAPGSQRLIAENDVETNGMSAPTVAGNRIFFSSYDPAEFRQGVYKMRLWVSEGGGPARVIRTDAGGADFSFGFGARPVAVGNILYFPGQDSEGNVELWRSDGTSAGTYRVKDLLPAGVNPTAGSWPEALTNVNGTVYFTALDGPFDPQGGGIRRLYKTDGNEAGTVRVSDTLRVFGEYPNGLPSIGSTVYLNAVDEADPQARGGELYRTDGTAAGTRLVADVVPGPGGISPLQMTVAGSRLFFVGWDAGYKLYASDGTEAGTRMLADSLGYAVTDQTYPLSGPYGLTAAGDKLYFVASDGSRGAEVWRSDGTPQGTAIVRDLNPGRAHGAFWQVSFNSISLTTLAPLGDAVIFSGSDGQRGAEVWKAEYAGEPTGDAGAGYRAAEGEVITLSAAGSRPGEGGAIVSYEWDLDFDGAFEPTATGPSVAYTGGDGPRTAFVAVRVTDTSGTSHIDTAPVVLSDRAPTLSVTGAATTTEGAAYALRLAVADSPGNDRISTWWVDWGDGSDTQQVNGSADGSPVTVTHIYGDGPAQVEVTVVAADEDGTYAPSGKRLGVLDPSFGAGGRVDNPFRSDRAVAVLPDGRIITAGGGGGSDLRLSLYRPDGSLDPSFGNGGNLATSVTAGDDRAAAIAVQRDGKFLVAGASAEDGDADWFVARFNPNGTLDATFGQAGVAVFDAGGSPEAEAADVALYPDGRIAVAGTAGGDGLNFGAALLAPDGSVVQSFGGSAGVVTTNLRNLDRARAVAIQGDGKIVVAGVSDQGGSDSSVGLVRYNLDGTIDRSFGNAGIVSGRRFFGYDEEAFDLAIQRDGKLVVGGRFTYTGNPDELAVLRYLPGGSIDTTFAEGGRWRESNDRGVIRRITLTPGGNITFVGGEGLTVGRLTSAGWPDHRFGRGWPHDSGVNRYDSAAPGVVYRMTDVAVAPDGNVVALGYADDGTVLLRVNAEPTALSVNVANVPPTGASAGPDRTVREGDRVAFTGAFTDPGVNERRTFRWRVTASNGQVVPDGSAVDFNFVPADEGTYTVQFTVADESGQSSSDTAVITVDNAPPVFQRPIPDPIPNPAGTEGREVVINAWGAFDPGTADTVTQRWSVSLPGGPPLAQGEGYVARFTPVDDGVYYLQLTATDNDGASAADLIFLNVANTPPQLALDGSNGAFVGDEYVLSLTANDPSPADHIRSWRVVWGDGQSSTYGPGDTATARHTYVAAGQYSVQVSATDDDGTYAAQPKTVIVIAAPALAGGTLTVTGTALNDVIELRGEADGRLTVLVNGARRTYGAGSVTRVVVNTLAGGDVLNTFGGLPETSADLGDGNDMVVHGGTAAGSGLTVVGGAGNDSFQADGGAGGNAFFDGGANTTASPRDTLVFNGTAGDDTIRVNPAAVASLATVTVSRAGGASVGAANVEGVSALGGDGNDTVTLADTSAAVEVLLSGGLGDDTFVVGDPARPNVLPSSRTTIDGSAPGVDQGVPEFDSVIYNDQASGAAPYELTPIGMTRVTSRISHLNVEKVTLNAGAFADSINVIQGGTQQAGGAEFVVNAGLPAGATPNDFLRFTPATNATGGQFTETGPGAGTYTFTNYRPVSFTGVERLTGPDYTRPAVVSASFVPAPRVEVEFLFSEDVRNSLQPQDLLLTHLATGQNLTASGFMDLVFRSAPGAGVPTRAAWVQRNLQNMNPGRYRATIPAGSVRDVAGNTPAQDFVIEFDVPQWVTARRIFYNNSAFDGGNPAATAADDNAVAPALAPLLPGQSASPLNVTNYAKGINGIMIDMFGVPGAPAPRWTADDFEFHVGKGGDPSAWAAAPRPASVSARISGPPGSYRVTVTWADGLIKNTWLRVMVKPTANTGLASPDVFYWGNLLGEAGDAASPLRVSATDVAALRRAISAAGSAAVAASSPYDVNRDGRVNSRDLLSTRANLFQSLGPITWPAPSSVPAVASSALTAGNAERQEAAATSVLTA
jgi:uncharacterized delta-60 repeat protein